MAGYSPDMRSVLWKARSRGLRYLRAVARPCGRRPQGRRTGPSAGDMRLPLRIEGSAQIRIPMLNRKDIPAWMLFAPTSAATFSRARHTFRWSSVRSQFGFDIVRPFSPVSRRRCSSASVRIFPPASTSHGASAMPKIWRNTTSTVSLCYKE